MAANYSIDAVSGVQAAHKVGVERDLDLDRRLLLKSGKQSMAKRAARWKLMQRKLHPMLAFSESRTLAHRKFSVLSAEQMAARKLHPHVKKSHQADSDTTPLVDPSAFVAMLGGFGGTNRFATSFPHGAALRKIGPGNAVDPEVVDRMDANSWGTELEALKPAEPTRSPALSDGNIVAQSAKPRTRTQSLVTSTGAATVGAKPTREAPLVAATDMVEGEILRGKVGAKEEQQEKEK